jgi:hypothetical protein
MKISELVERLTANYAPDDEIIVAWWDQETVGAVAMIHDPLTDDEWARIVAHHEGTQFAWENHAADALIELVDEYHEELPYDGEDEGDEG